MRLGEAFVGDLRHSLRSLAAAPMFSLCALLSLAVGLAAAAASVSFLDALGLRPLAVSHPDTLVRITLSVGNERAGRAAVEDLSYVRSNLQSLSGVAIDGMNGASLSGSEGPPQIAMVGISSGNLFSLLGVQPARGREFTNEDDDSDAGPVAILSDRLWHRRYGADPNIVGRAIDVNGVPVDVAGIAPEAFGGLNPLIAPDLWVPLTTWRQLLHATDQSWSATLATHRDFTIIGRLAPGQTMDAVQAELDGAAARMAEARPDIRKDAKLHAELDQEVRRRPAVMLARLGGALIGLVVLVGCANVTGLLLGRGEMRRREMATRAALGATRARLIRQLIVESLVLAISAGALGLLGSWWLIHAAPAFLPDIGVPFGLDFRLDAHVLAVTSLCTLVTIGIFGLFPAFAATRVNLSDPMKLDRASGWRRGRLAFRRVLVAGQVAVAMALVVASGLLMRNLWNTQSIPLGFTPRPALLVTLAPSTLPSYRGDAAQRFFHDFADALRATPGVTAVTMARRIPLSANGGGASHEVDIPGARDAQGRLPQIHDNSVAPNYFEVMGTRMLQGSGFPAHLSRSDPRMVVINETMARKYWPAGDALGHTVQVTGAGSFQIAGIVETGKYNSVSETPEPYMFFASDQMPVSEMTLVIATAKPADVGPAIRETLNRLDARMPTLGVLTLDEQLDFAMYQARMLATLMTLLGALGLALSLIGLYAVISFLVACRRREIGVRVALGARPRDVVVDVLKQTASVSGWGIAAGLVLAGVAAKALANSLVGVGAFDPATYASATVLVTLACVLAVWQPARRAATVDPAVVLRDGIN